MSHKGRSQDISVTEVAADILCEFLEVAFHSILYIREIYPAGIFHCRKKYNVPVQMSCHPELNEYIASLITSLKKIIQKSQVYQVSLIILDMCQHPQEQFVFEIAPPAGNPLSDDSYLLHLEQSLRAFLLKLNTCDSVLMVNPPDCHWTVQVHTTDAAVIDMQQNELFEDFAWIPAEEAQMDLPNSKIVPLKSMNCSVIKMQLYVEESGEKHN